MTGHHDPGAASTEALLSDLRAFEEAQRIHPDDHIPPYQCALIHVRLGDREAAIRSYREAIERNPMFAQAYYNLGLVHAQLEQWEPAEQALRRAIQIDGADPESWANLGAVLEAAGKTDEALQCYRAAEKLDPRDAPLRRRKGALLLAAGRLEQARREFEVAVDLDAEDATGWNNLGLVLFRQGQVADAKQHYLKALEVDKHLAQAWNNLGNLYAQQHDDRSAEEAYRQAAVLDRYDPDIWFNLGELYFRRNNPDAERYLARVVELNRQDMEAWDLLRQWYSQHPNYPNWKSTLRVLLTVRGDDVSLRRELAHVQEQLGEHGDAAASLLQVLATDADDEPSRLHLVVLLMRQNELQHAFEHMGRVQATSDGIQATWYLLGQRLLYHQHYAQAETCFLTVIAHQPHHADCWQYLGDLAMGREGWELAFERYGRAADVNRNHAGVWLTLARRFDREGNHPRALACLDYLREQWRYMPESWAELAPLYARAGKLPELLDYLESLLVAEQIANRHWLTLATLFDQAGLPERKRACLEHLERPAEELTDDPLLLARYHLGQGDLAAALRLFREAEQGAAADPQYWSDRADAAYRSGDMDEARACYEHALKLSADNLRAWFRLGNIYHGLGRTDEARDAVLQVIRLDPREPKAWYNLGCIQQERGAANEALASFRRAVALERRFAQAWNWIGILQVRAGNMTGAHWAYRRCVVSDRESVNGWYNLGCLFQAQEEIDKSIVCLERAEALGGVKGGDPAVAEPAPPAASSRSRAAAT